MLFSIMGVASVFVAATDADGSFEQPVLAAIVFGAFWSAFTLLGIYVWVFSEKYTLDITEDMIEQTGVFTQRRIAMREIKNAKWRNWPQGGSIKLETTDSRMFIELGTSNYRECLTQFLHSVIPTNKQTGWDAFLNSNEKTTEKPSLSSFWLAMIFYAFAASFVIAWIIGLGAVNLIASVINCGFATYLLTRKSQDEN